VHRSYLYVPGDRPDRLAKALGLGADAVIADLEDGVAPEAKDAARAAVAAFLGDGAASGGPGVAADGPEVIVRVNPGALLAADLGAVVAAGVSAVYLPKADTASLGEADALLGALERGCGRAVGEVGVVALVESATGLLDAPLVARHPRVRNLAIGEADLTAELGLRPSADEHELWPLRLALVVASAAAGIDPPTAPVSTDFRDLDALRASTGALRRAGFAARSAIHPAQVAIINEVFTPSATEVAEAERLLERFDAAVARGNGVGVDDRGRMVDEAVVRSARRLLARRPPGGRPSGAAT